MSMLKPNKSERGQSRNVTVVWSIQNGVQSGIGRVSGKGDENPAVARHRRQNASVRGLVLSFPPFQTRLGQKCSESARVSTPSALRPALARECERESSDALPSPPKGAFPSSATDGEVAKSACISASTPCACSSRCSS
eukprot:33427-Pleurochrysis_carterae.AAC.1